MRVAHYFHEIRNYWAGLAKCHLWTILSSKLAKNVACFAIFACFWTFDKKSSFFVCFSSTLRDFHVFFAREMLFGGDLKPSANTIDTRLSWYRCVVLVHTHFRPIRAVALVTLLRTSARPYDRWGRCSNLLSMIFTRTPKISKKLYDFRFLDFYCLRRTHYRTRRRMRNALCVVEYLVLYEDAPK